MALILLAGIVFAVTVAVIVERSNSHEPDVERLTVKVGPALEMLGGLDRRSPLALGAGRLGGIVTLTSAEMPFAEEVFPMLARGESAVLTDLGIDPTAPALFFFGPWNTLRAGLLPGPAPGLVERAHREWPNAEIELGDNTVEASWQHGWNTEPRPPSGLRLNASRWWQLLVPAVDVQADVAAFIREPYFYQEQWLGPLGIPTSGWGPGLVTLTRSPSSGWDVHVALYVSDEDRFLGGTELRPLEFAIDDHVATSSFLLSQAALDNLSTLFVENAFRGPVIKEVTANLQTIQQASADGFSGGRFPNSTTPNPPQAEFARACADGRRGASAQWTGMTWSQLSFSAADPLYYSYQYDSSGSGSDASFTVSAFGDLDCDGVYSTFVGFGDAETDRVELSEGLYMEDITE